MNDAPLSALFLKGASIILLFAGVVMGFKWAQAGGAMTGFLIMAVSLFACTLGFSVSDLVSRSGSKAGESDHASGVS